MTPALEHHKRQVTRFYREIWNRPDLSVVPEILAPDISFRGSLGAVRTGHAQFGDYVRDVTEALGDLHGLHEQLRRERHHE